MLLNIDRINLSGGTQTRDHLNNEHVAALVELIDSKLVLPAVEVVFDGSTYWLWDGFHRVEAHKLAGHKRITTKITQGTQRDAVLLSLGANSRHGLPRNNGDKKRAVMRMLLDDEWSQWPNEKIAKTCACTKGYVKRIRLETLPTIPGMEETIEPTPEPAITRPTRRLDSALPGSVVQLGDGTEGTVMNITDGGAIFQVMPKGGKSLKPMLRGEFEVIAAAPAPSPESKIEKLTSRQQLLELKRFVAGVASNNKLPSELRAQAESLLKLTGK